MKRVRAAAAQYHEPLVGIGKALQIKRWDNMMANRIA